MPSSDSKITFYGGIHEIGGNKFLVEDKGTRIFLESNKDKAFTEDEILRRLYPEHTAWPVDRISFNSAVLILAYAGKIETRYVTTSEGVQIYFSAK